ncbi:MAG: glycosyltransferase family 8 protein [Bacteroidaceae bacterium]|nr:glycosyltransferase family 8 protein [Bacteroidaceae bacterium]
MDILLCFSDRYTMPSGVTICSICVNNIEELINFHIISDRDFTDENKNKLRTLVSGYPSKYINFYELNDELINTTMRFENHWWPKYVFYRLFMEKMLPSNISKVLYLDSDIIVRNSLSALWNENISDVAVGCVIDALSGSIEQYNRLGFSSDYEYFNAGVLLVNLEYWRTHNITDRFVDTLKYKADIIKQQDQDVLNYVLHDSKRLLKFTYNFQSGFMYKLSMLGLDYNKYKNEIDAAADDPIVLHLSGMRPWISGRMKHPYESEFFKYKALSIWRDDYLWPCNLTIKTRIINFLRPFLSKFGICHIIQNPFDSKYKLKRI